MAVAEELHFGRARGPARCCTAAREHDDRPDRASARCSVFERTSRRVQLTPAGEQFLTEAKRLIDVADQTMLRIGEIRDGAAGHSDWGGAIGARRGGPRILRRFRGSAPIRRACGRHPSSSGRCGCFTKAPSTASFTVLPIRAPRRRIGPDLGAAASRAIDVADGRDPPAGRVAGVFGLRSFRTNSSSSGTASGSRRSTTRSSVAAVIAGSVHGSCTTGSYSWRARR